MDMASSSEATADVDIETTRSQETELIYNLNEGDTAVVDPYLLGPRKIPSIIEELRKSDPVSVITSFQRHHAMKGDMVSDVSAFLDLLGVERREIHSIVLEMLIRSIIEHFDTVDNAKHALYLQEWYKYVLVDELRPIPVKLLESFDAVPEIYLEKLSQVPQILAKLPLTIRRQVWVKHPEIFETFVQNIVLSFLQDSKVVYLYGHLHRSPTSEFIHFSRPADRRANDSYIKVLSEAIQDSLHLYETAVQVFRDVFASSRNFLVCVLRQDLLMSMHDRNVSSILSKDSCYKASWCLDACIRENTLDDRRAEELKSLYLSMRDNEKNYNIVGDLAMVLAHPFVVNLFVGEILKELKKVGMLHAAPKDSEKLRFLTAFLVLGNSSHRILRDKKAKFPKAGSTVFKGLYPLLASWAITNGTEAQLNELKLTLKESKSQFGVSIVSYFVFDLLLERKTIVESLFPFFVDEEIVHASPAMFGWFYRFLFSVLLELRKPDMLSHFSKLFKTFVLPIAFKFSNLREESAHLFASHLAKSSDPILFENFYEFAHVMQTIQYNSEILSNLLNAHPKVRESEPVSEQTETAENNNDLPHLA